jgi:outer membrane protein OmpA-like peptidoglycan-associated protein
MVGWTPEAAAEPVRAQAADSDGDGILDSADACPRTKGERSDDRLRSGCPRADRDGDGALDVADACPGVAGPQSIDPTKNGCPPDRDEDGIADANDACPDVKGSSSKEPGRHGCPNDGDGDGVLDIADACPFVKGEKSRDRARNGCPEDVDGDGMKPPEDACPFERGARDPDPQQSGCPRFVRVTATEIVILQPVRFLNYGTSRAQTVDPVSDEVLADVRDVINQHPEIKKIEVQGHTDDAGHPQFNEHLSQERAESVSWWLFEAGIPKEKLVAKGYGGTMPIADNRTSEGRQKNRRVQFVLLEKQ